MSSGFTEPAEVKMPELYLSNESANSACYEPLHEKTCLRGLPKSENTYQPSVCSGRQEPSTFLETIVHRHLMWTANALLTIR